MVEPDRGVYQWQGLASDEYKVQLKVEIEHKMSLFLQKQASTLISLNSDKPHLQGVRDANK
jgi:hypothetical protein